MAVSKKQRYSGQKTGSSFNLKPPRSTRAVWKPAVPLWEREFCKAVGSLDWNTFLELKMYVHLEDKIIKWDDSASEEAFHSAKNRFFARIQGLPCGDLPVNDPDMYNDSVDWEAKEDHDQDLLAELDSGYDLVSDDAMTPENHEPVLIFGAEFYQERGLYPIGWGDIEESRDSWPVVEPTGWGDEFDDIDKADAGAAENEAKADR